MSDPLVVFDAITKSYDGRTRVVHPLDLAIERGEFITLLGPSGSGKTTTLMMLAGFEDPSSGSIHLDGRLLNRVPAHQRGIGVVFQNYALFPHMSVAGNLSFPLEMQGIGRAEREERIKAALEMVKLGPLGDRKPSELSGGQQQRVALARALVFKPTLVLMDEPLGALDKQLREHMQIEIKHIHEQLGVTVVYVTHDQSEALTMSNRVAVFNHGRIEQLADPATLYDEPANAFVASFIGENNQLAATLVSRNGPYGQLRLQDGSLIEARLIADTPPGARVLVCLRPERVMVGAQGQSDNVFQARIEELIYFGDHTKVRLSLGDNASLMARTSFKDRLTGLQRGALIPVSWSKDCARILPPDDHA